MCLLVDISTYPLGYKPEVKLLGHRECICMFSFCKYCQFFKMIAPFTFLEQCIRLSIAEDPSRQGSQLQATGTINDLEMGKSSFLLLHG